MKVSVYCLVYNHEKYLRSALEGFVSQKTKFDFEVFVHDDASTDGSRQIIEEFAGQYPKIIKPIYQQENQYGKGLNYLHSFILPHMTGEYVAICEGDDCWTDPMKLQLQADFLDSHPEYAACVHNTVKKDMRTGQEQLMYSHEGDVDLTFDDAVQGGSCCYHTTSLMYRVAYADNWPEFFKKAVGYSDYPMAIYLTLSGKVRFLNRAMSVYRVGTESSWTKANTLDTGRNARFHQSVADMLESVDSYTAFAYIGQLKKLILKNRYQSLFFQERYGELRKEPYREIYRSMPLSYRAKTYIKQYCGGFYHFYRRLVYGKK